MPTWSVAEILQQTESTLSWGDAQRQGHGVSTDSRTVQTGELLVALHGEHFDGQRFAATAMERLVHALAAHEGGG